VRHRATNTLVVQILKEKLAFPSGTATAHLISVLHKMPPIDSGIKHRKGYQALSDDITLPPETPGATESEVLLPQSGTIEQQSLDTGWLPLIWSFAASSGLTVNAYIARHICRRLDARATDCRLLLPCVVRSSTFRKIFGARMGVVVLSKSILCGPRSVSLSMQRSKG
jgi:hypothetical protein